MALSKVDDSATIGTTEYFLGADATVKALQTDETILQVFIDLTNMASGDQYEFKMYNKIATVECITPLGIKTGDQGSDPFILPAMHVAEGWDISVKRLAGSDRVIGWSLRKAS